MQAEPSPFALSPELREKGYGLALLVPQLGFLHERSGDRDSDPVRNLIDKFAAQVHSGTGADLEMQKQILHLIEANARRLTAKVGRPSKHWRDWEILLHASSYEHSGEYSKQQIYELLGKEFHLSAERVKSILQCAK